MVSHIAFLGPDISDADARLADYPSTSPLVSGRKSAPLQARARTIPRMDALPYDKTAKSERFSVENLEAGCIIVASHAAP